MHTGWSFYPKAGPGQGTLEKSQGALASRSFLTGLKGLDPVPWVGLGGVTEVFLTGKGGGQSVLCIMINLPFKRCF